MSIDRIAKELQDVRIAVVMRGVSPPPPRWSDVEELLDEIERLRGQCENKSGGDSGWRPIETAPEHEDVLIAQVPSPMVWAAYRVEDEWYFPGDDQSFSVQPTHWRPLPAAPGKPKARCGMCGTKMENPVCGANDCPQRLVASHKPWHVCELCRTKHAEGACPALHPTGDVR